jgi:transcription elongation GreA/GreB family factor
LIEAKVAELEQKVHQPLDEDGLALAQRELRYWRTRQATAQLAPPPPADEAAIGSRVTFMLNGERKSVEIVGDDEADPHAGLISFSAPLARALIGAGAGDLADFGGQADAIEILDVAPRDA